MYKATLRDIEQKCLGADEAHTALLREVSDEHPAGLEGQQPGPHCPASTFSGPPPMSTAAAAAISHSGGGGPKGLKGLVYIYVKSICVLGTPPLSHQLPSQPGQSDQQTGDFAHFTQQRSYGRQFAYSSCSEPNMGRLGVYHDHLAAQSILVND